MTSFHVPNFTLGMPMISFGSLRMSVLMNRCCHLLTMESISIALYDLGDGLNIALLREMIGKH